MRRLCPHPVTVAVIQFLMAVSFTPPYDPRHVPLLPQVHSPVCMTEEAARLLDSILDGPVRHIIVPNTSPEHWVYAPQAAQRWPEATMWLCPGA